MRKSTIIIIFMLTIIPLLSASCSVTYEPNQNMSSHITDAVVTNEIPNGDDGNDAIGVAVSDSLNNGISFTPESSEAETVTKPTGDGLPVFEEPEANPSYGGIESGPTAIIERVDRSVITENGKTIGVAYYDLLFLPENSEAAALINAFFENECQGFFEGANRLNYYREGRMGDFLADVERYSEIFGVETLEQGPLYNIAETSVMFFDEELISVRTITYWMAGQASSQNYYGTTFDRQSGEKLSLDHFVNADIADFRSELIGMLFDRLSHTGLEFDFDWVIGQFGEPEYEDIEYYYDGDFLYIVFNNGTVKNGWSGLLRWNGILGEQCETALVGYPRYYDEFVYKAY